MPAPPKIRSPRRAPDSTRRNPPQAQARRRDKAPLTWGAADPTGSHGEERFSSSESASLFARDRAG